MSGDTNAMCLSANGNIGIGTTSPTAKLEVNLLNGAGWSGNLKAARFMSPDPAYFLDLNTYIAGSANVGYHFSPNGNTGLVITTVGNVGIGTTNPTQKLSVNGSIRAKEVIVEASPWPDYVFEDNYQLAPLSEVEQRIKSEKHLPGIPSAAEVAEHGLSMGEMQARLLAKMEEMTLYMIELKKENTALRKEISLIRTP